MEIAEDLSENRSFILTSELGSQKDPRVWIINKGSCRSSQVFMEITAKWYHASLAEQVVLYCTGDLFISNNMKWEKFKNTILNNASHFKYSVYGNTSLQQKAFSYCLSRNLTPNWFKQVLGFFQYHIYMVQLAATFPLLEKITSEASCLATQIP